MDVFESIADRRITAARKAGLFDNLPGAGRPIADLGRERPPGWWAERLVRQERSIMKAEELDRVIAKALPALWRLESEAEVVARVGELNESIDTYNRATSWKSYARLVEAEVVERWRQLRA